MRAGADQISWSLALPLLSEKHGASGPGHTGVGDVLWCLLDLSSTDL